MQLLRFIFQRNPMLTLAKLRRLPPAKVFVAFILVALSSAAATAPIAQADPARVLSDIKALSAPEMEGRGAGTKGLARAADLIVKRYKELNIPPAGSHGYLQPFTLITGARLKSHNALLVVSGDSRRYLTSSQDFVPFSF